MHAGNVWNMVLMDKTVRISSFTVEAMSLGGYYVVQT